MRHANLDHRFPIEQIKTIVEVITASEVLVMRKKAKIEENKLTKMESRKTYNVAIIMH